MKKAAAPLAFLAFCFLSFLLLDKKGLEKGFEKAESETEKASPETDFLYAQRAFGLGSIPKNAWLRAARQAAEMRKNAPASRSGWQLEGPTNVGGRIAAMAVHPSDPQTIYIGAAAGGVFKSTDGGESFAPIFDGELSLSMGDMAIAPSNKNVIYVGTGEANGGGGSMNYDAVGMYRSADAGQNWSKIGLETVGTIGKVAVSPADPNTVWVAAMGDLFGADPDRGVYKTTDGGQTWAKKFFQNDSTGCIDLALHPTDQNVALAAFFERIRRPDRRRYFGPASGIFRTTDGGATWSKVATNFVDGPNVGRIGLAASASQPGTFYAVVSDQTGGLKGFYRSTDGGATWQLRFSGQMPGSFYSSFGWWFGKIWVDPTDSERLFAAGVELFESKNGGQSWQVVADAGTVHADHHALYIDPNDPSKIYNGNDGGFYSTGNGGNSWQQKGDLPISQFYTMAIDPSEPDQIYGGLQDNGTWRTLSGNTDDWEHIYGGDGFVVQIDPTNNEIMYVEYQYGNLARSFDGGFSFESITGGIDGNDRRNWHAPYVLHPIEPNRLFFGTNRLWRSQDYGDNWEVISPDLSANGQPGNLIFGTITSISISPIDPEIIWCGLDDGGVWVTKNGGGNWQKVSQNLPVRWVTRVTASPHDPKTAFLTLSGYRWDEDLARVFRTDDGGQTWQPITTGLPDSPANDIVQDPVIAKNLWLATDVGVFFSQNGGQTWQISPAGLPISPVQDLTISGDRIFAATFGRSIFSIERAEAVSAPTVAAAEKGFLKIAPNPVADRAVAELFLNEKSRGRFALTDATGREVKNWPFRNYEKGKTNEALNFAELADGIYFLTFKKENSATISTVRLIKKAGN